MIKIKRRTVGQIKEYLRPAEIYKLITGDTWSYASSEKKYYVARDRAFMSLLYLSAGRVSAVLKLRRANLTVEDRYILVRHMEVVKRSEKTMKKYGEASYIRPEFPLPLKKGLFEKSYWDELVSFSQLVLEYIKKYNPEGRLFPFKRGRAWQIVKTSTGMFNHWFRAQSEHFYGNFLLRGAVELAKFVKVTSPTHVAHYIGYDWRGQLKRDEKKSG